MNVVTINCNIQKAPPQPAPCIKSTDDLVSQYPGRFEGIGLFPGQFHITLKEKAEPVVQPPRKYPIHLKDKLKMELDKMEDMGVIDKVEKPTEWVSALAFSRKSNRKLRICLDPKEQNI